MFGTVFTKVLCIELDNGRVFNYLMFGTVFTKVLCDELDNGRVFNNSCLEQFSPKCYVMNYTMVEYSIYHVWNSFH